MDVTKIGDWVWLQDDNHRHYIQGQSGPDYRSSFEHRQIVGETKQSWVLDVEAYKIDKKTGHLRCPNRDGSFYGLSSRVWWSDEERERAIWVHDHRYNVARAVQLCDDDAVLFAIYQLLLKSGQITERT